MVHVQSVEIAASQRVAGTFAR